MALYEILNRPVVDQPVLIMFLDGFIDAGGSANLAARTILGGVPGDLPPNDDLVGRFDSEALIDYRARRPTMHLVDGVNTALTWPMIDLRRCRDQAGRPLLMLVGPEPDHLWPSFGRAVAEIARDFDVRLVINLGAYPAATPHTRPPHITATATTADLPRRLGVLQTTLDVPAGIHAVIEHDCAAVGIAAVGVWAQVPHYAAQMPYPASAIALLEAVRVLTNLSFDVAELSQQAATVQLHLDELVGRNDEHVQMVRQLELQDDVLRQNRATDLPTGDDIAAEVERFLREQNE